jgi:hypothetical protein
MIIIIVTTKDTKEKTVNSAVKTEVMMSKPTCNPQKVERGKGGLSATRL